MSDEPEPITMAIWIALLRGINVGGRNRLPMKSLASIFTAAGCTDVATYIQSGNVVFQADIQSVDAFARTIGTAIEARHGFLPGLHLIERREFANAIAANPYEHATADPKSLHVFFLNREPASTAPAAVEELRSPSESFEIIGRCLFLHAPDGIARSKFARVDKALQTSTTARNWRTVNQLRAMADALGAPTKDT